MLFCSLLFNVAFFLKSGQFPAYPPMADMFAYYRRELIVICIAVGFVYVWTGSCPYATGCFNFSVLCVLDTTFH